MRNPGKAIAIIGAAAAFIVSVGGAATYLTRWYRSAFPTPPPSATSTAYPPTTLGSVMSSLDIAKKLPGSLDGYTFDENGQPFDYHEPPARDGFLVQYRWTITGRGAGDVYYSIENDSVEPASVITPLTHVGIKVNDRDGNATNEETDFFVQTGVPKSTERLTLIITCMITLANNSATQTSELVALR